MTWPPPESTLPPPGLPGSHAEGHGREGGYCKGKGGSMHIADFSIGMLGADGIVGAGLPIASGAGVAAQLEAERPWADRTPSV